MINVTVTCNATDRTEILEMKDGSSVGDCLRAMDLPTEGVSIRKNYQDSNIGEKVYSGDRISVTRKNLKGAEVTIEWTVDDILNAGKGGGNLDNEALVGVAEEYDAERKKEKKLVYKQLVEEARKVSTSFNNQVSSLEKDLVAAKKRQASMAFALNQLVNDNLWSLVGLLGMKGDAKDIATRLGIAVPENDSSVWATS